MTEEQRECPFEVGDLVRHRASGKRAVVCKIQERLIGDTSAKCIERVHRAAIGQPIHDPDAKFEYTGSVILAFGFGEPSLSVQDFILEKVRKEDA